MIKNVEIKGLRGKSFELPLGAVNLVIGENTAGKTTIADAIRWGLLGYIPGMAQPPRGWVDLLASGETSASVSLDLGPNTALIWRTMTLEKGSLKVIGSEGAPGINILTLDPAQFFAATGPKKAQLIAEASVSSFDWKALVPEARRNAAFKGAVAWSSWVGQAIDSAKAERSKLADRKKTLGQTLRGLEAIRDVVIENDSKLKEELAETQQQLGVLKDAHRAVTQQIQNVQQTQTVSKAQARLDQVRHMLQEHIGRTHEAETIEDRLRECKARLDEFNAMSGVLPGPHELEEKRRKLSKSESDVAVHGSRILQIEAGLKMVDAKYVKLKKAKKCPTCGATGAAFTKAVMTLQDEETAGQQKQLADARFEHKEAIEKRDQLQARWDENVKALEQKAGLEIELSALKDEAQLIALWREHDELVEKTKTEQIYDVQALEERRYDIFCEMEDQNEVIGKLEKELNEATYKRSQKRQLAEIEAQLEAAEAGWTEQNAAVGDLDALRERFTAMSLEPILATLELFTKGIFEERLSLDGAELGRMVGNRWVPLDQFSGAEQAVAYAAFTCALQQQGSIVLADELSAFDDEHLTCFLRNVVAAIEAGKLAQFIGFSTPRKNAKAWPKAVLVKTI